MSRSLVVYAVDFAKVIAAAGSGDTALVDRLAPPGSPPVYAAAVAELIHSGVPPFRSPAPELAFAQEALCRELGRALDNAAVSAADLRTLEAIDIEVAALGLGVSLETLMYGGGPIRVLPWPDDFPSCGRWSTVDVTAALHAYRRAAPTHPKPEVDAVFAAIGEWLEIASDMQAGLAGFYY